MSDQTDLAASGDRPVVSARSVHVVVYLLLLALAALLAWDNWRTGMAWEADGPQAGYFPFYLSVILGAACLFGLFFQLRAQTAAGGTFVTRDQLYRVMQVLIPTLLFCVLMQWLGLYVASFVLIAGFMRFVGRMAPWKSLAAGLAFSIIMFLTFDVAFDVIMPKGPLEALFGY
jgi:putative tricarboxylic transport membrane protein